MKTDRRSFLKLGALATAAELFPLTLGLQAKDNSLTNFASTRLDYTKAKATPTICFGCTNHCSVIGWIQNGIVRKFEGNPLDPNTQGNLCSKAQGMISYTYYPCLLYTSPSPRDRG